MNRETALFLDHVEDYLKSVTLEITKARQFEDGTTDQARHIDEAKFKLQEALTVMRRVEPVQQKFAAMANSYQAEKAKGTPAHLITPT